MGLSDQRPIDCRDVRLRLCITEQEQSTSVLNSYIAVKNSVLDINLMSESEIELKIFGQRAMTLTLS